VNTAKSPSRSHKHALKSAHFVLSAVPSIPLPKSPTIEFTTATKPLGNVLLMAIPKRLLKHAVHRNAVKRVCREAWREVCNTTECLEIRQMIAKPKLVKLVNLPKFSSTVVLKRLMRADVDNLFAQLK
jgi:Ribonuclease P